MGPTNSPVSILRCSPPVRRNTKPFKSAALPLATHDRPVYREYHALLLYKLQRRDELDRQIEELARLPVLAPMISRLQCFRGISLHSAMVLATEIVDWRRFARPAQLAFHLGLVSREHSSGDRTGLARSRRPGIVTAAMSSSRRRGATAIARRRASIPRAGSRGSRPLCELLLYADRRRQHAGQALTTDGPLDHLQRGRIA